MSNTPSTPNKDLVTFTIKSNGSPIPATYEVLSIFVDKVIDRIPYCDLEILDATDDFSTADSDFFLPGASIEVSAGYENSNTSIFKGIILKQEIKISSHGPVLHIQCKDEAVKMTIGHKNTSFKEMKDSDIISKLISNNGLTADVASTATSLKEVVQYNATDWDFIVARAQLNDMIVVAQNGKVSVARPNDVADVALSLTYGNDIYELAAEIDAEAQLRSNGWPNVLASISKYTKVTGTVKFQRSALAVPGKLVNISGVGKRFSGKRFIAGVSHLISDGNWVTTAQIGLSPEWFVSKVEPTTPQAPGLLPGIQGLKIGRVKQISEDPLGQFRVLVKLPYVEDGVWARLATFYATANAGAFFYPEIDDEVAIGFFDDDPGHPVILGAMYSKDRAGAYTPDEQNSTKAFVSREQMKIAFDEEKKVITITTPANNQLVLSDEAQRITLSDQNGNFIKLSTQGIEINSASDLKITTANRLGIGSLSGAHIDVDSDLSLRGLNVECKADVALSASGNASASLTAAGELTIQGALVMIN